VLEKERRESGKVFKPEDLFLAEAQSRLQVVFVHVFHRQSSASEYRSSLPCKCFHWHLAQILRVDVEHLLLIKSSASLLDIGQFKALNDLIDIHYLPVILWRPAQQAQEVPYGCWNEVTLLVLLDQR